MSRTPLKYSPLALAAGLLSLGAVTAQADQVINDDLIVTGSLCVGFDCTNGESFGFDTIRLKENNVRIKFQDTSTSASFPSRDWQITANDSSNGGANKFSIDDIDGGRTPFTIEAGAPSNSLYVDDGGRVGFGTATPVVELHVVDGDSPTLRLEQDGSSGFTAQTWDIASNETNFFIRDVSNGSQLPFRIQPGADTNSLYIADDNNVGIGTNNPGFDLHVFSSNAADPQQVEIENSVGGAVQLRLTTTNASNRAIVGLSVLGTVQSAIRLGDNQTIFTGNDFALAQATLSSAGLALPSGASFSVSGTNLNVPDYVFDESYSLMPLSELKGFIAANAHLPNVPSAAEINQGSLNMTEMQLTLLKKVEELTLYTLQQQAQIEMLEEKLATSTGQ